MSNMSIGLMHEVAITGQTAGWDARDFANFAKNRLLMAQVRDVMNGNLKIVKFAKLEPVITGVKVNPAKSAKARDCFSDEFFYNHSVWMQRCWTEQNNVERKRAEGFYVRPYEGSFMRSLYTDMTPEVEGGLATNFKFYETMTEIQIAQFVLGVTTDSLDELSKLLIEKDKTFSPYQVEDLVLRDRTGEKKMLFHTDSQYFFIHDDNGRVSIMSYSEHAIVCPVGISAILGAIQHSFEPSRACPKYILVRNS